jgi:prepilin-type N-terminal cleavage/methylation domain-containing protein
MLECLGKKEKGFTLMELLIAVAIVVILAGVGIPVYLKFMTGTKHAEASTNLSGIKLAEEGYKLANGVYLLCAAAPRDDGDVNQSAVPWSGDQATWPANGGTFTSIDDFTAIDFSVSGDVRFAYAVDVPADPTTFTAGALGDTDGDGTQIMFTATNALSPAVVTADTTVGSLSGGIED